MTAGTTSPDAITDAKPADLVPVAMSPVEFRQLLADLGLPTDFEDPAWTTPNEAFRATYKLNGRARVLSIDENGAPVQILWDREPDRFAALVPAGHYFLDTLAAIRTSLASFVPVPAGSEDLAGYARWLRRRAAAAKVDLDNPPAGLLQELTSFLLCHARGATLDGVNFDTARMLLDKVVNRARRS